MELSATAIKLEKEIEEIQIGIIWWLPYLLIWFYT
jgi:hypothetical protein